MSKYKLIPTLEYRNTVDEYIDARSQKQLDAAHKYLKDCGVEDVLSRGDRENGIKPNYGKSNEYAKKYGTQKLNAHPLKDDREGQYAVSITDKCGIAIQ